MSEEMFHRRDAVALARIAITSLLCDQRASLTRTAHCMRMHKGRLKSVLSRNGLSFTGLRDRIRFELSVNYLAKSDIHIAEVAMLVGFAEESSFFRAFKRWSGETPGAFRRRTRSMNVKSA